MILFNLCGNNGNTIWKSAAEDEGISYQYYGWEALNTPAKRAAVTELLLEACRTEKAAVLFSSHGMEKELEDYFRVLPAELLQIPLGADAILLNRGNLPMEYVSAVNEYAVYAGDENVRRAVRFIRKYVFGDREAAEPEPAERLPFDGIYSFENSSVFRDADAFFEVQSVKYDAWVGILSHRSYWINRTLEVEKKIAEELNKIGIGVIPVFASAEKAEGIESLEFPDIVQRYFSRNQKLCIEALINLQMHLIKAEDGLSISENSARMFMELDIPVFHPIVSYSLKPGRYEELQNPLAEELASAYLNPEMAGMTEPVLAAIRDMKENCMVLQKSNINLFARRVKKWIQLRKKENREKKIAVILHNAVCSGVEATVGRAFGLDALESTVRILKRLQKEGYTVEGIPENGEELRRMIFEKKAFSDFRWTSVEDILESGGCICRMDTEKEYLDYFHELPEKLQKQMTESWGEAPGEGMVWKDSLVITGLSFGNILVMVEPKRGCYGAKCTGEVCRILHDPLCPPPHQYLAVYRYLERNWKADALIHVGTDGSLEYLPGKANGLSEMCWPQAVLGSLPNFYPYHIGVLSEGTVAKRRANAVLFGHYPAASGGLNEQENALMELLEAYSEAAQMKNGQEEDFERQIREMVQEKRELQKLLDHNGTFLEGVQRMKSSLLACAEGRRVSTRHVFGKNPEDEECIRYLCEVLRSEEGEEHCLEDEAARQKRLSEFVRSCLDGTRRESAAEEIRQLYCRLKETKKEEDLLIHVLSGGYLAPSEGGMPDENGRKILPAGRNFYMMNTDKIPSREAYERGKLLAEQLLEAYQKDEGRFPSKIAMNMISVDISRTHGEQLSQFLYLLGVEPVWDSRGRVTGLRAIPVSELGRPRIDITLRISGVMRDTWPDAIRLMDEAVIMVSELAEKDEENYIRANIRKMEAQGENLGERAKTIRIFGDPPGTFGAGIDLALKASAWESEKDLARYFIQSSAFAYGKDLNGRKSVHEFIENVKRIDASCDISSSRRADTLSCGFGLQVQGGFRLAAQAAGGKQIRQYQNISEPGTAVVTKSLGQCVEEDIRRTLLNAVWREHKKEETYDGAADMMQRIQNVFDAQCTSSCIADSTLTEIASDYINDPEMREWLLQNNPYAAEEITRRLLELESRGKWKADEETLEKLKENYLTIEGCMEGETGGNGEIQGGSVEIVRDSQVERWKENLREIDEYLNKNGKEK